MTSLESIKKHKYIITISCVFVILYSLISLVNHYLFRTYALDLGLYTNAAYKYAHLLVADSSMIKNAFEPILGGHFDLYLLLFSPLTYLFGSYTLLIVQITAIIIGGIGIYRYFQITGSHRKIPYYGALYFYLFFGVYAALSFDYHSVVVASCVVPWFFISIHQNRKTTSILLLILMLISQENFALFVFFICLGLIMGYRKDRKRSLFLLLLSFISLIYFLTVVLYFIPTLSSQGEYGGFLYTSLGDNMFEAIGTLFTHPIESFEMLFTNHNDNPQGDYVKAETYIMLLLSGLFILVKKPQYLFMLIPIIFQKFYHDNHVMWSIDAQYNIEFAPIMAIGIFKVVSEFKNGKSRDIASVIILILTLSTTIRVMDNTIFFTDKSRIRFYKKDHYQRDYNVEQVYECLSMIPENAKVSAQSPFVPHLSMRKDIYLFPLIKDADYVVYSDSESHYPLTKQEFQTELKAFKASENWEVVCDTEITVWKKVKL